MMFNHIVITGAMIATVAATHGALAQAGPDGIRYDCDTGADRFSELVLPTGPAPFFVTGKLKLMNIVDSAKYMPMARITISENVEPYSADLRWAGLEYRAGRNAAGNPPRLPMLAFSVLEAGKTSETRTDIIGPPSATEVPFSLSFDGAQVSVSVDGHEKKLAFSTDKPVVRLTCSTGEFLYSDLRIRPID